MIKPELFDLIELIVNLPAVNQFVGSQGTIVECFNDGKYEIEFTNEDGETIAQCALSSEQFIVVWQSKTKQWVSISDKINAVINNLSEDRKKEVLNFARFLYQGV
jgi:hypothetical protein